MLKVNLFMATSVNGMIARKNYSEDFLPNDNWKSFCNLVNKIGCFIVGRKTYDRLKISGEYLLSDLKSKVGTIVVSRKRSKDYENTYFVKSPQEAIKKARDLGFKEVVLAGGGKINSEFIKKGLVEEIILNVNPVVLGKGISIFREDNFEKRLKLLGVKRLNKEIVQLHYKVK